MKTFVLKFGNPVQVIMITQAETMYDADAKFDEALEKMGYDTDHYSAELSEIKTPIVFI